MASLVLTLFVY